MKLRKIGISIICLIILLSPVLLFGQNPPVDGPPPPPQNPPVDGPPPPAPLAITIGNPLKSQTLYGFINDIVNNIVLPLGGVIAVLYIMYAGFLLVTARGDEKQIGDGKKAFTNAAIGTAILLGAWVIAGVIENTIDQLRAP